MNQIKKLQQLLEKKLEKDWDEYWHTFGEYNTEKHNRRSKFYETLSSEISEKSGIKISRDTIQRFDKGEGGNSKYTLDAISKYLGFESFEIFASSSDKQSTGLNKKWLFSVALLPVLYLALQYFYYRPKQERIKMLDVILQANQVQFEAFQKLDSTKLKDFYTDSGTAKKGVITVIETALAQNRHIDQPKNNPSYYKLLSSKVLKQTDSTSLVATEEHWFLKWYDTEDKKYKVSYDERNSQYYELKKVNNNWKVDHNFFEGKATPINY